jgi:hypothetical protein
MTEDQLPVDGKAILIGAEYVYFCEGEAVIPPPGTMAPPRPPGMERVSLAPGEARGWEYVEVGGEEAIIPPLGTMPPPRPPGMERRLRPPSEQSATVSQPQPEVTELVSRIESALEVIHMALAEIKRIQNPPQSPPQPQSKAG